MSFFNLAADITRHHAGLDRFTQGLPDPQADEVLAFAVCEGPRCGIEILPGDSFTEFDGHCFHDNDCFAKWMGAEDKTAPGVG